MYQTYRLQAKELTINTNVFFTSEFRLCDIIPMEDGAKDALTSIIMLISVRNMFHFVSQ